MPVPKAVTRATRRLCRMERGSHAQPPSDVLLDAVAKSGLTGCLSCHRPLASQHDTQPIWSTADEPGRPQAGFNPTLQRESVTCAACHIRDARVAVQTEEAARGTGPHVVAWADDLGSPESCAACHQLTWPGANVPLYDTFGEWQRSAWAAAGVGCVDLPPVNVGFPCVGPRPVPGGQRVGRSGGPAVDAWQQATRGGAHAAEHRCRTRLSHWDPVSRGACGRRTPSPNRHQCHPASGVHCGPRPHPARRGALVHP